MDQNLQTYIFWVDEHPELPAVRMDQNSNPGDYIGFCIFMVPSGKRLHNYGKSPFWMGKFTINGHFQ